jgi:predicted Fe-Mo cluster-binding NifX family protein
MFGIKGKNIFGNESGKLQPIEITDNLSVISVESFLENKDDPIIWRGPLKISIIKQFIGDVSWSELDFLIIDSPPGTGDEPLTVAQEIKDAQCLIVTTPQEVALSDVRKSIEFCKRVKMDIIGIVENMSVFLCPHCNKEIKIFDGPGSQTLLEKYNLDLLGEIPIIKDIIPKLDKGELFDIFEIKDNKFNEVFTKIADKIREKTKTSKYIYKPITIGFALTEKNDLGSTVSEHFGTCPYFMVVKVENNQIIDYHIFENSTESGKGCAAVTEMLKHNLDYIVAGGMGAGAKEKFLINGVKPLTYNGTVKQAVDNLLNNKLSDCQTCGHEHC